MALRRSRPLSAGLAALLLAGALTSCGGGDGDDQGGDDRQKDEATSTTEGAPRAGGRIVYAIEAESSEGWCLGESQLAASGIQVARSMFETLTVPNADGDYSPFLAESVTPNPTFDEWTIELREGITFHDGSPFDAEVVKNNLDAYRGEYPTRHPVLPVFTFSNVADVQVSGPMTVTVTTKTSWPAFPGFLFQVGRIGMMAQAQLDDIDTCAKEPIGTGPFRFVEWKVNDHLTVERNPDYWREGLPYLDGIEFRPVPEGDQRLNGLEAGQFDVMHSGAATYISALRDLAEEGKVNLTETDALAEVQHILLNVSKPPFDNVIARRAVAQAIDRDTFNQVRNLGLLNNASGPFPPGTLGYLEDAGYPDYDFDEAKRLVAQYEEETGGPLEFTLSAGPDPAGLESAQLLQQMVEKAGADVSIQQLEQAQLIRSALGGEFQASYWRQHPGGDPDNQSIWWYTGSPLNFNHMSDPELDRLLDEGRVETDPEKRREIYESVNRRFGEQVYDLWLQWGLWAVATAPEVAGVTGPDLPDGGQPSPGMAWGHSLAGLWVGE